MMWLDTQKVRPKTDKQSHIYSILDRLTGFRIEWKGNWRDRHSMRKEDKVSGNKDFNGTTNVLSMRTERKGHRDQGLFLVDKT